MNVHLPDVLEGQQADIKYFVDSMVRKLACNTHKGWAGPNDVPTMLAGLIDELNELELALNTEGQFAAMMEAVDVANMAMLVAVSVLGQTKEEYNENRSIAAVMGSKWHRISRHFRREGQNQ